jgi:hypothetical protein
MEVEVEVGAVDAIGEGEIAWCALFDACVS